MKFLYRYQKEIGNAARGADAKYCQAKSIVQKVMGIYRLKEKPGFLPNPVKVTEIQRPKGLQPTVCFVGRWDSIKRPELFLELSVKFPKVKLGIFGACQDNIKRDSEIRASGKQIENVEAPGWLNGERRRSA